MKSNRKKRIIAAVLCMVMVLSSNISALAGEELFTDTPATVEEMSSEPAAVSETEAEVIMDASEAVPEMDGTEAIPDEAAPEASTAAESTASSENISAESEETAEVSFSDGESEETPSAEATPEEEPNPTPEQQPEAESQPETDFGDGAGAEEQILSGATELKQEFADAEGNVIQKVTANLPVGAFAAETSAITMEVNYLDTDSANYMKSMMTERVSEGMELGSYVFFDIQFKVNGEKAEALQPITITIEGSGLNITDTKKTTVFYFDPADAAVEGDKDELKEIPQRAEVLESLQAAGQGTENIEDYDLSEITFREDGTTDKVIFEGRKSTIYGCYTEEVKPAEETPANPETASEIEIISDEVNLRTEPDTAADNVAAVAYTGERFPLLENVQMEDALWYKIRYTCPETGEAAELYVRSDFARIVDESITVTDDESVNLTEEPGLVNELTYEDDSITVSVSAAEEGIIPDGAVLSVKPITAENAETQAQYEEVAQHVEEKVTAEGKKVAGFLAYDITFADAEGNKLEPNGEVKVSMNYKQAAIPETVQETGTENTEVSVLHLEEDAIGAVQNVVDMTAEETAAAVVQTTENAEVQSAEFNTASFSVYTITWTQDGKWNDRPKVKLKFVDEKGNSIESTLGITHDPNININTDNGNLSDAEGGLKSLRDIGEKYSKDSYYFLDAHINTYNGDIATNISYNDLWYSNNPWIYYKNEWKRWPDTNKDTKEVTVYMVYGEDSLSTVETVDHTVNNGVRTGITMRMIDYESPAQGINIGGPYTVDGVQGKIKYDLLNNKLKDGYPVTKNGESLESLFSGGQTVNHLFLKSVYDATGYYEYSSFDNYAYLDDYNDDYNFKVYDAKGTPSDSNAYYFQRGNFMPYNQIKKGKFSTNRNLYDEYGKDLATNDPDYNERLYKTQGNNNFYFGMYLESDFLQPKGGMAVHNGNESPMRYEFNGDDDLWVYIDDVLVLDIGGIHDAHSGYIDFSTGKVGWYDCAKSEPAQLYTTTIKKMFTEAGASTENFNGDTFKDYTKHNFKMFYMERGAGASNLHVKFNLQTIPDGQIQVTKQLKQKTDPILYGDVSFGFELYVEQANGDGQGTGEYSKVTSSDVSKYNAVLKKTNGTTERLKINGQGKFYLKPRETAVFNDIPANLKYYVKEVSVDSDKFDKVEINGTTVTEEYKEQDEQTYYAASSTKDTVENRPAVVFTNSCNVNNLRTLQVEKKMADGQTSSEEFRFLVKLEGEDGQLHPYQGAYTVFEDKNAVSGDRKETTDGYITLKQNEIANIYNILSETDFEVTEDAPDQNIYENPSYQVSEDKHNQNSYKEGQTGTIQLLKDAKVIVTNSYKAIVSVEKIWKPSAPSGVSGIYVGLYQVNGETHISVADKYVLLNEDNDWKHTFTGMSGTSGQYVVRELQETSEAGEFIIDGKQYSAIAEGSAVMFADTKYVVNYKDAEKDSSKQWTITNTAPWQMIKISENKADDGNEITLSGAVFTATDMDDNTYTGTSDANGVVKWVDASNQPIENLPDGKIYTVRESHAPSGYTVSSKVWTVDLTGNSPAIRCGNETVSPGMKDGIKTFYFTNKPLYSLPSSGGSGIFGYMISGVALMMAAMFILYKMRRKGVLRS